MNDRRRGEGLDREEDLGLTIGEKEERKARARAEREESVWFGLGMFGLVGWSVAIPTLAALALGIWIDRTWPSRYSWTLMFLLIGVAVGALNAWYWICRERRAIERPEKRDREDE